MRDFEQHPLQLFENSRYRRVSRASSRLTIQAIFRNQIRGAFLLVGNIQHTFWTGVGQFHQHHLRAFQVVGDCGLQHSLPHQRIGSDRFRKRRPGEESPRQKRHHQKRGEACRERPTPREEHARGTRGRHRRKPAFDPLPDLLAILRSALGNRDRFHTLLNQFVVTQGIHFAGLARGSSALLNFCTARKTLCLAALVWHSSARLTSSMLKPSKCLKTKAVRSVGLNSCMASARRSRTSPLMAKRSGEGLVERGEFKGSSMSLSDVRLRERSRSREELAAIRYSQLPKLARPSNLSKLL